MCGKLKRSVVMKLVERIVEVLTCVWGCVNFTFKVLCREPLSLDINILRYNPVTWLYVVGWICVRLSLNVATCSSSNDVWMTGSHPDHQAVNVEWISGLKIVHLSLKYTRAHGYQSYFFIQFVVNIIAWGIISVLWPLYRHELLKFEQALLNIGIHRAWNILFVCVNLWRISIEFDASIVGFRKSIYFLFL
jgi:hypothetical protein